MAQEIQAFECDHLILNQGSAGNTGTAADLRGRGSRGPQIIAQIGGGRRKQIGLRIPPNVLARAEGSFDNSRQ